MGNKISRRAALGSVAASAFIGIASRAEAEEPQPQPRPNQRSDGPGKPVKSMTLEQFQQMDAPVASEDLFRHIDGHTFTMCHRAMKEKHGIWIPELVPVFKKMDAMRAAAGS